MFAVTSHMAAPKRAGGARRRLVRQARAKGRLPAAVVLALLGVVVPVAAAPGSAEVVNIASCVYPDGEPEHVTPATMIRVVSNPARTDVVALACPTSPPGIIVAPPGSVLPGTPLEFTVTAPNDTETTLVGVRVRFPLDAALGKPQSITQGAVETAGGTPVTVTATYDAVSREVVWQIPSLPADDSIQLHLVAAVRPDLTQQATLSAAVHMEAVNCPEGVDAEPVQVTVLPPALLVTKRADRSTASPGDAVIYQVTVLYRGSLDSTAEVELADTLPAALRYVPGSSRRDGERMPDPARPGEGAILSWALGQLRAGESVAIRYAALVGPVARRGVAVNRAGASGRTAVGELVSPEVAAAVTLTPGPFRPEAYLAGRVFVDDDEDGLPGDDEPGVPGVLVLLENGRGAVTDINGRWHLEGVRPGTHVARLDPSTLPADLIPRIGGADWARDPSTRFFEARASNLVPLDFPVGPAGADRCTAAAGVVRITLPAASLLGAGEEPVPAARTRLDEIVERIVQRGVRGNGAEVRCTGNVSHAAEARLADELRSRLRARATPSGPAAGKAAVGAPTESNGEAAVKDPLEALLRTADPRPTIVSPADGAVAVGSRVRVEVVYPLGTRPDLRVNGERIPMDRIGTIARLPSRGIAAARYVGVALKPGENRLSFRAVPPAADAESVPPVETRIVLPDRPVELRLTAPGGRWVADGVTPAELRVEALDRAGLPTTDRMVVGIRAEGLEPVTPDLEPDEDGLQVKLTGGSAMVRFSPPALPGRIHVTAWADGMDVETDVPVAPGGGPWRVVGLVEGRAAGDAGVEGDGGVPMGTDDGISNSGGRVAVFARGPVGPSSRLTFSLDTDRSPDRNRLGSWYEPDLFYPVPGDNSHSSDEAERQGRFYARVDGPHGFARYGDFRTGLDRTELVRYDRRMDGLSGRAELGKFSVDAFAASTDQRVVRDVFAPDGTSGPFLLRRHPVVARSETVMVEIRDRFRSDVVLRRDVKRQDLDYDLDPVAGTLLFRGPVAAFDQDLNPARVVVIYEARDGGSDSTVAGARAAFRLGNRFEVGTSAVVEGRDGDDLNLLGLDVSWKPMKGTTVRAEVASSDEGEGSETATKLDLSSRPGSTLRWEASYQNIPAGFANPGLLASPEVGGRRAGGSVLWTPSEKWRLKGEALSQKDDRTGLERRMAGVQAERRIGGISVLGGVRSVASNDTAMGDRSSALIEAGVRGKIAPRWKGELVRRQALGGETVPGYPSRTAAGVAYRIREGTDLYLRQELESGDGPDRDRTMLGVESRLGSRTRALANYALEDGATGAALRATAGVETTLPINERASASFSAARVDTTRGDDQADYTSLAGTYEYRAGSSLLTGRYELRLGKRDVRHLITGSGVVRPREAWTVFLRERLFVTSPREGAAATRAEGLLGAAYRPLEGRLRFLARLDHQIGLGSPATAGGVAAGSVLSEPAASAQTATGTTPFGLGTAPGRDALLMRRDAVSISVAAGWRINRDQRLGVTVVARKVGSDPEAGIPGTLTHLLSLHHTAWLAERWTLGESLRRFTQRESGTALHGAGIELGYLAFRNVWVTGGYNFAGFEDPHMPLVNHTDRGPFLTLRLKFDETGVRRFQRYRPNAP